ncbi:MAG: hypothetical protein Q4B77_05205 [Coriobacteriaceae bacterium]|nr:hypothetical protein [Coriobacteriaceae bacterium]
METTTIEALIALNNRFYTEHAASFSATRSAPWNGWRKLAQLLKTQAHDPCENPISKQTASQVSVPIRSDDRAGGAPGPETNGPGSAPASPWGALDPRVLDLACGNMRFEQFLSAEFPSTAFAFHAVDSCTALAPTEALAQVGVTYHEVDVLQRALAGRPAFEDVPACSLSVCFGFMHHIPSYDLRQRILAELVDRTSPHGLIVVSFWQFMHDERLARKARRADQLARGDTTRSSSDSSNSAAFQDTHLPRDLCVREIEDRRINESPTFPAIDLTQLDQHDHFLGWQSDPSPLRYCHHFTESEIDALVASVAPRAQEVARFSADGASDDLNRYVVLKRVDCGGDGVASGLR